MSEKMPGKDGTEVIANLITVPFRINPPDTRLQILKQNRPRIALVDIKKEKTRGIHVPFNELWYDTYIWLCGSASLNKLFCWPCLLMRPETSSWCSTGVDEFGKFQHLATKHSTSKSHMKAITEYDAALVEANMPPEFTKETDQNRDNKQQRGSDSDSDHFGRYLSPKGANSSRAASKTPGSTFSKPEKHSLTFQAWQQANQALSYGADAKLIRRRRRLAHLEIKNAQLMAQKLRLEIKILEGKLELQQSFHAESQKPSGSTDAT